MPFLVGRWLSFFVFALALTWATGWIMYHRPAWPLRFPRFILSLHGSLFYGLYLLFFLHPALTFRLQTFADLGSLYIMHVAWYLLFSQLEEDTRFFSERLPRWVFGVLAGVG